VELYLWSPYVHSWRRQGKSYLFMSENWNCLTNFSLVFHTEKERERNSKERLTMQNTTASKWLPQWDICPDLTQVSVVPLYVNFDLSVFCGVGKTGKWFLSRPWMHVGVIEAYLHFLNTALDASADEATLPPRINPGVYWIVGCVGTQSRCGRFWEEKTFFLSGFELRTVQPVAWSL